MKAMTMIIAITSILGIAMLAAIFVAGTVAAKNITTNDIAKMTTKPTAYIQHCNQTEMPYNGVDLNNSIAVLTSKQVGNAKPLDTSTAYVCIVITAMSQQEQQSTANSLARLNQTLNNIMHSQMQ